VFGRKQQCRAMKDVCRGFEASALPVVVMGNVVHSTGESERLQQQLSTQDTARISVSPRRAFISGDAGRPGISGSRDRKIAMRVFSSAHVAFG